MAPTTEKKTLPEAGASGKKRTQTVEFEKHIYEVAMKENPELEITGEAIDMMNEMMNVLHKIVDEAARNAAVSNQTSLNIKDFKVAVKQLIPRDLKQDIKDRESQQLIDVDIGLVIFG